PDFGTAIVLSGCIAIISATAPLFDATTRPGLVHVFDRCKGEQWVWVKTIVAAGTTPGDYFGAGLALSGNDLLVGAPGSDNGLGAVYYYVHSGDSWTLRQRFVEAGARAHPTFGRALGLHDSLAVVSGSKFVDFDVPRTGFSLVFKRTGAKWSQLQELEPQLPGDIHATGWDAFGSAILVTADRVLIGAPGPFMHGYDLPGFLFVYKRNGDALALEEQLEGFADVAYFGASFAVDGRTLVVGSPAYRSTSISSRDGEAYVYQLPAAP
ncbi:MAG TPA: FG-GAP repeat protein, partial [Steroidobacteraceae bacterium]|nr:FG-GAP repeat protein [Steroidobacteraceae bacterium]